MSLFVILLVCLAVFSEHTFSCPVGPPCVCRMNETDPYTLELEYVVDCSGLGLTAVPLFTDGGETVDKLLLGNNRITKLYYGSFLNIRPRSIDITTNGLQVIADGSLIGLEQYLIEFLLGGNNLILPLTDVKKLTNLKILNLDDNPNMNAIPSQSFSGLASLEKLTLSRSQIRNIEQGAFAGLSALTSLDFYGNLLTEIPTDLSGLNSLTYLDFDSNEISEIKGYAFSELTSLKELQLSRNSFSSAADINADAFAGLGHLETLGFYHDLLGSVPSHAFSPLVNLNKLDLSYTNLPRIEEGDFSALSITELDISGNHIHFEPGMFQGIEKSLNNILIRKTGLTSLPVLALSTVQNLRWIDAASNDFPKDLPSNFTQGLPGLKRIGLMWMDLTSVQEDTFDGVAEPFDLGIYSNQIKSLDFITDPCKYRYVDVSENPIHCDCHVYNLTQTATTQFTGTCFSPASYKGLDIAGDEFQRKAKVDCAHYAISGPVLCPWAISGGQMTKILNFPLNLLLFIVVFFSER